MKEALMGSSRDRLLVLQIKLVNFPFVFLLNKKFILTVISLIFWLNYGYMMGQKRGKLCKSSRSNYITVIACVLCFDNCDNDNRLIHYFYGLVSIREL